MPYSISASVCSASSPISRSGTDEVWILGPEPREVLIFSSRGDRILRADAELSTELLPGFRVSVQRLFEDANQ